MGADNTVKSNDMSEKKTSAYEQISGMTGLKMWKVQIVLAKTPSTNLHRVTDDEIAVILHAAAEIGYVNPAIGMLLGTKVKEVTLEMVAKRAGVSVTTVFNALQSTGGIAAISKPTRTHVLSIVKELGYKPTSKLQLKNFHKRKQ